MISQTRTDQIVHIIHGLAALPGSVAVDVTSIKFPRLGPAETISSYEKRTRSYPAGSIPDVVTIPPGAEEIIIRLQGRLPRPENRDELVEQARNFFSHSGIRDNWDLRANFPEGEPEQRFYELTIFASR